MVLSNCAPILGNTEELAKTQRYQFLHTFMMNRKAPEDVYPTIPDYFNAQVWWNILCPRSIYLWSYQNADMPVSEGKWSVCINR